MEIKVLGTGCAKCQALEKVTLKAVDKSGVEATVEKVQDIADIMEYNVMAMPALVIDEKVVMKGKVPSVKEVISLIS